MLFTADCLAKLMIVGSLFELSVAKTEFGRHF